MEAQPLKETLVIPQAGVYHCIECDGDTIVPYGDLLTCQLCRAEKSLVIVYQEEDPQEEMLHSRIDWIGG